MRFGPLNIPDVILEQNEGNKLVIFAGAGVSMAPPSNLPNFDDLTQRIAGTVFKRDPKSETFDQFLGRVERNGVNVHQRCHQIISSPQSAPSDLHRSLLKCFHRKEHIKIVTTNFDNHFTNAFNQVFSSTVDEFFAPALPLASDFTGIVYLHGSIRRPEKTLVLTDADFGRAYITSAWAARFLIELFASHTVLFVGYSHSDSIVSYLARGIPLDSPNRRFAITDETVVEKWHTLGITPITYATGVHSELACGLDLWQAHNCMSFTGYEAKIKGIVEFEPSKDPAIDDYLMFCFERLSYLQYFCRYAKLSSWLEWVNEKGHFSRIASLTHSDNPSDGMLASWMATVLLENERLSVELFSGIKWNIGSFLWHFLVQKLSFSRKVFTQAKWAIWIDIIQRTRPAGVEWITFDGLLRACDTQLDADSLISLFSSVTRIEVIPRKSFFDDDSVIFELKPRISRSHFESVWRSNIRPLVETRWKDFMLISERHLATVCTKTKSFGVSSRSLFSDLLSSGRSAIEPHEQDQEWPDIQDLHIDILRDCLDRLCESDKQAFDSKINDYVIGQSPVFQRLAINAIRVRGDWSALQKLSWVMEKGFLFEYKHETFTLIGDIFTRLTIDDRQALVNKFLKYEARYRDLLDLKTIEYEKYNFLTHLSKVDPQCQLIRTNLELIQRENSEFVPRDYPDLDRVISGGSVSYESPIKFEELLVCDLSQKIDWMIAFKGERWQGPSSEGLRSSIAQAVSQDFAWSLRFAEALALRQVWTHGLWQGLFDGWTTSSFDERRLLDILEFLKSVPQLINKHPSIVYFLSHILSGHYEKVNHHIINSIVSLIPALAKNIQVENSGNTTVDDWLNEAINSDAGMLAECAVKLIDAEMRIEGSENAIPDWFKSLFEESVSGSSYNSSCSACIFGRYWYFLMAHDEQWTRRTLGHLLSETNTEKYLALWHGVLWVGIYEKWVSELLPHYETLASNLTRLSELIADKLLKHIAVMSLHLKWNPLNDEWLYRFLQKLNSLQRRRFLERIGLQIESMKPIDRENKWNEWLAQFISDRVSGLPITITDSEIEVFCEWATILPSHAAEIVARLKISGVDPTLDSMTLHRIFESSLCEQHPDIAIELVTYLIGTKTNLGWALRDAEMIAKKVISQNHRSEQLEKFKDLLRGLGSIQSY